MNLLMEMSLRRLALAVLYRMESRSAFLISAIAFRIALEAGYWVYVSPVHGYVGFPWSPDIIKYIESWMLYGVMVFLAPRRLQKPSDFLVVVLLFGLMTPLLSFYGLTNENRLHLYIVILGYYLVLIFRNGPSVRFPVLAEGYGIAVGTVVVLAVAVSVWLVLSGGAEYFNLNLLEVYDYRRKVGELINVGLMSYLNIWAYKVVGPTLLVFALWRRAYLLAVLVFMLHVFWFGVSAHRSVLFYPFLVVFVWLVIRRTRALSVVPLALASVVAAAIVTYAIFGYGLPASLFVRRAFYVLADNTFAYYQFFSGHHFVWWSNSITAGLIDYPYRVGPAELIGIWKGSGGHINNSFLSTGYMHAGIAGVCLYGVIAGLVFRLIDSLAKRGVPNWVALSVLIAPCFSLLLSSDLPTALLTHGVAVGMIILFLLRSNAVCGKGMKGNPEYAFRGDMEPG